MQRFVSRLMKTDCSRDIAAFRLLEQSCAQGGQVSYCYDWRTLRFQKFKKSVILLTEDSENGNIVGSVGGNIRDVNFGSRTGRVSSLCSCRVLPQYRRNNIAHTSTEILIEHLKNEHGVEVVYATTASDNLSGGMGALLKCGLKEITRSHGRTVDIKSNLVKNYKEPYEDISFEMIKFPLSEKLLRQRFENSFMFPSSEYPVNATIFRATARDKTFIELAVANYPDVFIVKHISWQHKIQQIYNYVCHAQPLIRVNDALRLALAIPFYVSPDISDPVFKYLLDNLIKFTAKKLENSLDLIWFFSSPKLSGLTHDQAIIFEKSSVLSTEIIESYGLILLAKLLSNDISLENQILNEPFWFIDGKEI